MFMFNDYCDSLELYARGLAQHCLCDRGQTSQHVAPCAWCGLRFHMVLQTFSWGIHMIIVIHWNCMQEVWRYITCVTAGKPASMWPHVHDVAYVSIWFCKRSRGVFTKRLPLHMFGGISCTLCRQSSLDGDGDGDTERDGVEWGGVGVT